MFDFRRISELTVNEANSFIHTLNSGVNNYSKILSKVHISDFSSNVFFFYKSLNS